MFSTSSTATATTWRRYFRQGRQTLTNKGSFGWRKKLFHLSSSAQLSSEKQLKRNKLFLLWFWWKENDLEVLKDWTILLFAFAESCIYPMSFSSGVETILKTFLLWHTSLSSMLACQCLQSGPTPPPWNWLCNDLQEVKRDYIGIPRRLGMNFNHLPQPHFHSQGIHPSIHPICGRWQNAWPHWDDKK